MDLPSNSNESKAAKEPELEKMVESAVTARKPTVGRRFMQTFFSGEDAKSVISNAIFSTMIPMARDAVADTFHDLVDNTFGNKRYSGSRRVGRGIASGGNGHVSYGSQYRQGPVGGRAPAQDPRQVLSRQARAEHDFTEYVITERHVAQEILIKLFDVLETYEAVTVANFYTLIGVTPDPIDARWGWTDLRGTQVISAGGGYMLTLPRPQHLPR